MTFPWPSSILGKIPWLFQKFQKTSKFQKFHDFSMTVATLLKEKALFPRNISSKISTRGFSLKWDVKKNFSLSQPTVLHECYLYFVVSHWYHIVEDFFSKWNDCSFCYKIILLQMVLSFYVLMTICYWMTDMFSLMTEYWGAEVCFWLKKNEATNRRTAPRMLGAPYWEENSQTSKGTFGSS